MGMGYQLAGLLFIRHRLRIRSGTIMFCCTQHYRFFYWCHPSHSGIKVDLKLLVMLPVCQNHWYPKTSLFLKRRTVSIRPFFLWPIFSLPITPIHPIPLSIHNSPQKGGFSHLFSVIFFTPMTSVCQVARLHSLTSLLFFASTTFEAESNVDGSYYPCS